MSFKYAGEGEGEKKTFEIAKKDVEARYKTFLQNQATFSIKCDLKAPNILFPDDFASRETPVMILDLGTKSPLTTENQAMGLRDVWWAGDHHDEN